MASSPRRRLRQKNALAQSGVGFAHRMGDASIDATGSGLLALQFRIRCRRGSHQKHGAKFTTAGAWDRASPDRLSWMGKLHIAGTPLHTANSIAAKPLPPFDPKARHHFVDVHRMLVCQRGHDLPPSFPKENDARDPPACPPNIGQIPHDTHQKSSYFSAAPSVLPVFRADMLFLRLDEISNLIQQQRHYRENSFPCAA